MVEVMYPCVICKELKLYVELGGVIHNKEGKEHYCKKCWKKFNK